MRCWRATGRQRPPDPCSCCSGRRTTSKGTPSGDPLPSSTTPPSPLSSLFLPPSPSFSLSLSSSPFACRSALPPERKAGAPSGDPICQPPHLSLLFTLSFSLLSSPSLSPSIFSLPQIESSAAAVSLCLQIGAPAVSLCPQIGAAAGEDSKGEERRCGGEQGRRGGGGTVEREGSGAWIGCSETWGIGG